MPRRKHTAVIHKWKVQVNESHKTITDLAVATDIPSREDRQAEVERILRLAPGTLDIALQRRRQVEDRKRMSRDLDEIYGLGYTRDDVASAVESIGTHRSPTTVDEAEIKRMNPTKPRVVSK